MNRGASAPETTAGNMTVEFLTEVAPRPLRTSSSSRRSRGRTGPPRHPRVGDPGGDPNTKKDDERMGTGGPGWSVDAEFNDGTTSAILSMARSQDLNSAASSSSATVRRPGRPAHSVRQAPRRVRRAGRDRQRADAPRRQSGLGEPVTVTKAVVVEPTEADPMSYENILTRSNTDARHHQPPGQDERPRRRRPRRAEGRVHEGGEDDALLITERARRPSWPARHQRALAEAGSAEGAIRVSTTGQDVFRLDSWASPPWPWSTASPWAAAASSPSLAPCGPPPAGALRLGGQLGIAGLRRQPAPSRRGPGSREVLTGDSWRDEAHRSGS